MLVLSDVISTHVVDLKKCSSFRAKAFVSFVFIDIKQM